VLTGLVPAGVLPIAVGPWPMGFDPQQLDAAIRKELGRE